ncbi:MAG TPA: hypothetical protein VFB12_31160 [Ktedonobacteraceae bacterium]|nr:hypothetical protein [Ktedonobacteraceae bacterium]
MGILTDTFIATEAELAATQFEGSGGPINWFPTVQGKNIDPVKLALLEAIVTGQDPDDPDVVTGMIGQPIRESEEEWICPFSDRLAAKLADLTTAEISRYGTIWASSKEWSDPRESLATDAAHYITLYLQEICQLAVRAKAEGKHMYMWIAL